MEDLTAAEQRNADPSAEPPPPFFRSWRSWYAFLIAELIFLIVLFRLLTVVFA